MNARVGTARRGGSKFSRIANWIPLEFIKAYYEGLTGQGDLSTLSPKVVMIVAEISTLNRRRGVGDYRLWVFFSWEELKRAVGSSTDFVVCETGRNNYFRMQSCIFQQNSSIERG